MAVVIHSDNYGTHIEVTDAQHGPLVEVFESRGLITLRQENHSEYADVVQLTLGQSYDMLIALSRMLDIPVNINGSQY